MSNKKKYLKCISNVKSITDTEIETVLSFELTKVQKPKMSFTNNSRAKLINLIILFGLFQLILKEKNYDFKESNYEKFKIVRSSAIFNPSSSLAPFE